MITIRRIRSGEVELYKRIRLEALREAPYAFLSTYEDALKRSPENWHEQADSAAQGIDKAIFFALVEDGPIALTALVRKEEHPDTGEIFQVWVAPEHRGSNLARDLMDAVFKWAGENHFRKVIATVTRGNDRAIKFYLRYGFILAIDSDDVVLEKEVKS